LGICAGAGRVGLAQSIADVFHVADDFGGVEPKVRVTFGVLGGSGVSRRRHSRRQPLRSHNHLSPAARVIQQALQPVLQAGAVDDEHLALGDFDHIGGGRLKRVRVQAKGYQRVYLRPVAGHILSDIGQKGLHRQDSDRLRRRTA